MRFRKRPVEIDAVPCRQVLLGNVPEWIANAGKAIAIRPDKREVKIMTLEGNMVANEDDWIIRGVKSTIGAFLR